MITKEVAAFCVRAGVDLSTYGQHVALGLMIIDDESDECSHCRHACNGSRDRVKLNERDRFWFQYCPDCAGALDRALRRIRLTVPRHIVARRALERFGGGA